MGADGSRGEQRRIWVLPQNADNVIRTKGTDVDRTDFARVRLTGGASREFFRVINPDSGKAKGWGTLDPRQRLELGPKDWPIRGRNPIIALRLVERELNE